MWTDISQRHTSPLGSRSTTSISPATNRRTTSAHAGPFGPSNHKRVIHAAHSARSIGASLTGLAAVPSPLRAEP